MFEKEAEEWINKEYDNSYYPDCNYSARRDAEQAFINGAEFGYNKCFEQIKKLVDESTRLDCIIPELLRLQEIEDV